MNFDALMEEQIKNIPEGTPLLLHACCAPCSSAVLERLANHFKITVFYYNPNISLNDEYEKRLNELKKFLEEFKTKYQVSLLSGRYDPKEFFDISKGLENESERGKRCYSCYRLRLNETALVAEKLGFDYFTTTLSLSPHKNAKWINEIGKDLNDIYSTNFLYCDFKKKNGYKRSIELSREYNLYRQDYCGCVYSKAESIKRKIEKNNY